MMLDNSESATKAASDHERRGAALWLRAYELRKQLGWKADLQLYFATAVACAGILWGLL